MLLALDYDDTYTRDPAFWDGVILLARSRGHAVICATMRADVPHEADEVRRALGHKVERIIFTNRRAKRGAVARAGYVPSVWIDDMPALVDCDAGVPVEGLHIAGTQGWRLPRAGGAS